jgi:predicted CXXCH cytochrome family protein
MAHEKSDTVELADVPPVAYRHDSRSARARLWLPIVAVLGIGLYWAAEYLARGDVRYTPGPLANVHASWDNDCAACHTGALPLGGNNWAAAATGWIQSDDQCKTCHPGPAHHESKERAAEVPRCATCHREHHGRQTPLTRMPDALCTSCHGDLSGHVATTTEIKDVLGFSGDRHPAFRERKDPGTIEFNHQLHLSPGLSKAPNPAKPFALIDITREYRERFRKRQDQPDTEAVQLDCASCHRGDGREPAADAKLLAGLPQNAVLPARSAGAYMQPILFERHCQGCHPLTIDPAVDGKRQAGFPAVRHRLQPKELKEVLRGYYTASFFDGGLKVNPAFLKIPLPGKNPLREEEKRTADDLIAKHVNADERLLFGASTCQKCHASLSRDTRDIPSAAIPQVWFEKAKFDHAAHRAVDCLQCHAGAAKSQVNKDVLLPDLGICQQCHAERQRRGDQVVGGARFDCVECHRYHNGEHPLQGIGASARQPAPGGKIGIAKFLSPGP